MDVRSNIRKSDRKKWTNREQYERVSCLGICREGPNQTRTSVSQCTIM